MMKNFHAGFDLLFLMRVPGKIPRKIMDCFPESTQKNEK
jgi:hypothetical protein